MTLAHLSDTHLGYRAYGRSTDNGVNQREVDVMKTFQSCLDAIAEREPDLVVHSGDLFHVVRPSNATIIGAFNAISKFQAKRAGRPFAIIGGNHDTPRLADSGNILKLFSSIEGVRVYPNKLQPDLFEEIDTEILAVPHQSLQSGENVDYVPSIGAKHSVLILHGVDHELIPHGRGDIQISETRHEKWTYVALGDFHTLKQYGANVCYAGSTDYASTNIWDEASTKFWVWFDTSSRKLEPVPVKTRRVIDLPRIDALKLDPREIEKRMQKNADWPVDEMPIVRQVVANALPGIRGRIDQAVVREIASTALHYQLDIWAPQRVEVGGTRETAEGRSLDDMWDEHMDKVQVAGGIKRDEVR
ncbi:MAG TPA: metallophosphoesterase, partial [Fimbriimonas sp.]|nr:metallophosphoesterase [Fimbriimonas sp.]